MKGVTAVPPIRELANEIRRGAYDGALREIYRADGDTLKRQRERYASTADLYGQFYGSGEGEELFVYSIPGRVELCGNHTDHNGGVVVASAVDLDIIAIGAANDGGAIRIRSRDYAREMNVDLARLEPLASERGKSTAMVRGVASGIAERGGVVRGFRAVTESDVIKGSGLSSSAAFEITIAAILNGEFNDGAYSPLELAMISQNAENRYFGKPSGLMDQIACAVGGVVSIDFKRSTPKVRRISFDLSPHGYKLVITDTKESHSGLTSEYAAIRREMESVARFFGKETLRQVPYGYFFPRIAKARQACGDRAVLRALHFFAECRRVGELTRAAEHGDIRRFLGLILESGHSSCEYNQNAHCQSSSKHQGISLGLALSQSVLGENGAWRLQGGGFAGAIQAFVPDRLLDRYCSVMSRVFGDDAPRVLSFRERGPFRLKRGL